MIAMIFGGIFGSGIRILFGGGKARTGIECFLLKRSKYNVLCCNVDVSIRHHRHRLSF